MTYIAIKIEADGKHCGGGYFAKYQKHHCPFANKGRIVDDRWMDRFHGEDKRLRECIAAEIPIMCASCSHWEIDGYCDLDDEDNVEQCEKSGWSLYWTPRTKGTK